MKIANNQIDSYIQKIAQENIAGCLLYGPDESVINYRFNLIAKKISPNLSDPFLVANISKEQLNQDSGLLIDEFYSLSFLGGRKLILIKETENSLSATLKSLFSDHDFQKKSQNFILIQAGDLDKSSALRKLCEDNSDFAAIACYEDDERTIKSFIEKILVAKQVDFNSQIIAHLYEKFGKNRQIVISELQKIITFLGNNKKLTAEIIDKLTASEADITANEVVMSFAAKKFDIAILQSEKLFREGFEAIALIRFISNYLQKLYNAKVEIESGSLDFEGAVKMQKLFFKTEIEFRKHLKALSLGFLRQNLQNLSDLEVRIKSEKLSSKIIFISFLQNSLINNKK
ncbi:MAG: DNA polymerase III subunit delta [Pelagibacterales bacterium]|nr:DNA polymerase III subunit delta [Pelagibacterales bacterium]